jgi:nitrogen regulatory protein P-II 1
VQLLIAVINREEMVEEVLAGFLEVGITGATLINSEGMGRLLSAEMPIFAGVEALAGMSRPRNQTLFSVVRDDAMVDRALAVIREVCGDMHEPATGIAFAVPVTRVVGLAPELGGGG